MEDGDGDYGIEDAVAEGNARVVGDEHLRNQTRFQGLLSVGQVSLRPG
jgi:hypothetical protein